MVRSVSLLGLLAMILATAAPLAAQTPLRVFPNPVSADRHLTLDHVGARDAEPEVFDVLGRLVDPGASLPAGRYVVRLRYADGRVSAPAPLTLATPGPLAFRSRESSPAMTAVPGASASQAAQEYALIYIVGDSQAAGKGDVALNCSLRPDVGTRGYIYQRALDAFAPVCDATVDLYNDSIIPALADEIYTTTGKIPLIVSYTVKGSSLTPEAVSDRNYWFIGDDSTAAGESFDNVETLLKRAKRAARVAFPDGNVRSAAGIHSFGGIDAKHHFLNGAGSPASFGSRLGVFDAMVSATRYKPIYFEIGRVPGKPQFDDTIRLYGDAMRAVLPADRITTYADYARAQHEATGGVYSRTGWYADRSGHLGALGLDYLGAQLARTLDL